VATAKPLAAALLIAFAAVPASAGPIVTSAGVQSPPAPPAPSAPAAATAVDAPPVLPLFAGALALLGWRLGRRRRR
jgi:hypothetical protein